MRCDVGGRDFHSVPAGTLITDMYVQLYKYCALKARAEESYEAAGVASHPRKERKGGPPVILNSAYADFSLPTGYRAIRNTASSIPTRFPDSSASGRYWKILRPLLL